MYIYIQQTVYGAINLSNYHTFLDDLKSYRQGWWTQHNKNKQNKKEKYKFFHQHYGQNIRFMLIIFLTP